MVVTSIPVAHSFSVRPFIISPSSVWTLNVVIVFENRISLAKENVTFPFTTQWLCVLTCNYSCDLLAATVCCKTFKGKLGTRGPAV